jgi:hypothetical protein
MSAATSRSARSEILTNEVREVVRRYVRQHGWKRGLYLAAQRMDVTERRAKALYTGEPLRVWADEWQAAMDADAALRRERAAALRAELRQIEAELDAGDLLAGVGSRVGSGQ